MNDDLVKAICEWLRTNGYLDSGVEFRFSVDLVQVLRDGVLVATVNPSRLVLTR